MNENFTGFTKSSLKFFSDLEIYNSKSWFDKNRLIFENEVLYPAKLFVNEMGERLQKIAPDIVADARTDKSIFRIHRDIRFSNDKTPYKTHLGIWFWEGKKKKLENPGFYLQFDKNSLFLGVGMYRFNKESLEIYRDAVVDPVKGKKLSNAVGNVILKNPQYVLGWKHYKQIPRGYDKNHPNSEFLLYGGIGFQYSTEIPEQFFSSELINYTFRIFENMLPIHNWLKFIHI